MKRLLSVLFVAGCSVSGVMVAQTPSPDGNPALLAAPASLREGATIIKWKSDFTYETVRQGTNRLACFDVSGMPGQQPFSVECTSIANLERVGQNLKFETEPDRAKRQAAVAAAEASGTRAKAEYGSVWYHLRGADREHAHAHTTIAVPGATSASTGLPDNGKQGTVWVMDGGTMAAHLMIPGQ